MQNPFQDIQLNWEQTIQDTLDCDPNTLTTADRPSVAKFAIALSRAIGARGECKITVEHLIDDDIDMSYFDKNYRQLQSQQMPIDVSFQLLPEIYVSLTQNPCLLLLEGIASRNQQIIDDMLVNWEFDKSKLKMDARQKFAAAKKLKTVNKFFDDLKKLRETVNRLCVSPPVFDDLLVAIPTMKLCLVYTSYIHRAGGIVDESKVAYLIRKLREFIAPVLTEENLQSYFDAIDQRLSTHLMRAKQHLQDGRAQQQQNVYQEGISEINYVLNLYELLQRCFPSRYLEKEIEAAKHALIFTLQENPYQPTEAVSADLLNEKGSAFLQEADAKRSKKKFRLRFKIRKKKIKLISDAVDATEVVAQQDDATIITNELAAVYQQMASFYDSDAKALASQDEPDDCEQKDRMARMKISALVSQYILFSKKMETALVDINSIRGVSFEDNTFEKLTRIHVLIHSKSESLSQYLKLPNSSLNYYDVASLCFDVELVYELQQLQQRYAHLDASHPLLQFTSSLLASLSSIVAMLREQGVACSQDFDELRSNLLEPN